MILIGLKETYNEDSDEGYFLEVGIQYPENFRNLHNNLPFLPERTKIERVEELVANLHDKKDCHTYKKFIGSIKSWICTEKSS